MARLGVRALAALGLGFSVSAVLHGHKLGHAVSTDTAQQRSAINMNTVHKCSELWVVGFNVWSLLSLPDLKPDSYDAKKGFIIVLSALSSCHSLIATRKNSTSPVRESSSTVIRCSTGCTHIPTGAENRSGGDRAERTPTTERVRGIPLPNQIRAETPGMHQTKPHPRSSPRALKRRRCWDARSMQDEDRGQGRLRIDRNSYLEVQDGPGSQRSGRTDRRCRK